MKIYLTIPYSQHEEESFNVANKVAAYLMSKGYIVFSPISHSHCIAIENNLPGNFESWKALDESFIEWCDWMIIVIMENDGVNRIKQSKGVQAEIKIAMREGKEIMYLHENNLHDIT